MSHEIRTPLNGILGMATLLNQTQPNSEQQEYSGIITKCGESLLSIINDILDFSKIESGKLELEHKDFDLRDCIEEVLEMVAPKVTQNELELIYKIDPNVPNHITGDSLRLQQVLMNLISNSIKFTERGEVFIGVNLKSAENNVLKLEFEVRDTGIGIPEDKVDRLFKAFTQVDSSTSRKYGGTGLGLVICEKLINLMGGSIGVESKPGVGTVFRFTITSMEGQKQFKAPVNLNIEVLGGKKILVVDDNLNNRSILKSQLEQWRLKPTLTDSGKHALEVLSLDSHFDIILTDLCMPEMDGLQLTKIIKHQYPDIPIILLSSLGVDRTKEYEKLYSSILTKPIRYRVLLKNILSTLGKSIEITGQKNTEEKLPPHFSAKFPLKILVVEDNLVNQKLAVRLLNKLGYKPDSVSNGFEAIKAMNQNQYDMIFMDLQMPEMDGLEATRIVRSQLKVQPIIIAMTANVQQKDREECLLAGMDDFIGKPINVKEMIGTIEKWALKIIR